MKIPFNKPHLTHRELAYIGMAHANGALSGDGPFTKKCHTHLCEVTGSQKALLTHSCTAALEMMALLSNIGPNDEVILPSFTFVSTANAFALRGARLVFVDIRPDTKNIDESLIESAVTPRTKAIVIVHYAGVACEMDTILHLKNKYKLELYEDAAQAYLSTYKGKHLGTFGDLGAFSFHETKNVISGEGGALLVQKTDYLKRAEIIREKGTNRSQFLRGEVDKYTWVDLGSSYLPGEIIAAFLLAQFEHSNDITSRRVYLWNQYYEAFRDIEKLGHCSLPVIPDSCVHNAHMFYLKLESLNVRTNFIDYLKRQDIHSVFHYIPLHSSPAGKQYGRVHGSMNVTNDVSETLVRLPLYYDMTAAEQEKVILAVLDFFR